VQHYQHCSTTLSPVRLQGAIRGQRGSWYWPARDTKHGIGIGRVDQPSTGHRFATRQVNETNFGPRSSESVFGPALSCIPTTISIACRPHRDLNPLIGHHRYVGVYHPHDAIGLDVPGGIGHASARFKGPLQGDAASVKAFSLPSSPSVKITPTRGPNWMALAGTHRWGISLHDFARDFLRRVVLCFAAGIR
jgi:hypothetical protein